MKKKLPLVASFALAALIVIGQAGFAQGSDYNSETESIGESEMTNMMQDDNTPEMMRKMHSSNGKNMMQSCMESCRSFMQSFGNNKKEK